MQVLVTNSRGDVSFPCFLSRPLEIEIHEGNGRCSNSAGPTFQRHKSVVPMAENRFLELTGSGVRCRKTSKHSSPASTTCTVVLKGECQSSRTRVFLFIFACTSLRSFRLPMSQHSSAQRFFSMKPVCHTPITHDSIACFSIHNVQSTRAQSEGGVRPSVSLHEVRDT